MDKNKDVISHLKQQNAELRQRVIQQQRVYISIPVIHFIYSYLLQENLSVHSNDSQGRKRQLQDDLIRIRREYDAQVTIRQERMKQKKKLEEQLNEMTSMTPIGGETDSQKVLFTSVIPLYPHYLFSASEVLKINLIKQLSNTMKLNLLKRHTNRLSKD